MRTRIPFLRLPASDPIVAEEYRRRFARVVAKGRFILGEEVARFEREFAAFCRARFSLGVGNGTEALLIALRLSGIRPGQNQEVITTPLTASFTAHAIVAAGARPVFADIDPDTLLLDPSAVRRRITRRTAAIVPVHLYGQCCDLAAFRSLAKESGSALIQDAAQAHGTEFQERPLADFSDWVAFSFYPTKNLGCLGDGGALVTNRSELATKARMFRDGGRQGSHVALEEGINSRLDEVQAAMLRIHLKHLKRWNRRREQLAKLYDRRLAERDPKQIRLLGQAPHSRSCHHLYVIRTPRRQAFREFLAARGIETAVHYEKPLHLHPAFRWLGYRRGDFPAAEQAAREVCSLPLHPWLANRDGERVVRETARFLASNIA
jgi:dTDP-4-amino-4,6-dideoxygalactose transaminase